MAVAKKETALFTYLVYTRESGADVETIRKELLNFSSRLAGTKDIVLDFTRLSCIGSAEIGAIVRLLNALKGTTRCVRIIACPQVKKTLDATNIGKLANLAVYDDADALVKEIKTAVHQTQSADGTGRDSGLAHDPPLTAGPP